MDGNLDNVTSDVLNWPDLYCNYCRQRLQYPIPHIENIGNLCGSCYEKTAYTQRTAKPTELEYVLVNLLIPCKYSYRGCNEKAKSLAISQHERICSKRDKICPFYELKKCSNGNHMTDLMEHFSQFHSSQIFISDSNSLDITYEINDEDFNEFWLLAFKDENVLLNIKLWDHELHYLMYYIGNEDDMKKITCKIRHCNEDICTQDRICNILHEEELDKDEKDIKKIGVTFSKEVLEIYFGQNINTNISLERDVLSVSNDDILARLECPICSNFMTTNVMLCAAGHSICNDCESKLDKCPICTLPFCGARNFALEAVGDLLKVLIGGEKLECPLRTELQCLWKGLQVDILEHMKDFHRDKIILGKSMTRVLKYTSEFSEVNYLMVYGQVFKIICKKDKYDDIMSVIIELIGHDEDAQKYRYNISFNSLYKQNIIWYTKSKLFTRRRIEYHVDYLAISRIVCNNQFNICYSIIKNKH